VKPNFPIPPSLPAGIFGQRALDAPQCLIGDQLIEVIRWDREGTYAAAMMSRDQCLARAIDLEKKMAGMSPGFAREEYGQLAAQWRVLADIAHHEERRQTPGGGAEKF